MASYVVSSPSETTCFETEKAPCGGNTCASSKGNFRSNIGFHATKEMRNDFCTSPQVIYLINILLPTNQ